MHMLGMPRMGKHFVTVATPKLDGRPDAGERFRRERVTDGRCGDHGGGDARVVHKHGRRPRNAATRFPYFAAGPFVGIRSTMGGGARCVRYAADRHQRGKTAGRETEHADPRRIDQITARPRCEHVVDQSLDVAWPDLDPGEPAVVAVIVAGMGDRGYHESRLGKRQRGIVMVRERTSGAVGHDDQRQAAPGNLSAFGDRLLVWPERLR
jgi:hypothetical protein